MQPKNVLLAGLVLVTGIVVGVVSSSGISAQNQGAAALNPGLAQNLSQLQNITATTGGGTTTPPSASLFSVAPVYGATSDSNTTILQKALMLAGDYSITPTGNFLGGTLSALKTFQTQKNIASTGVVNTTTSQALYNTVATECGQLLSGGASLSSGVVNIILSGLQIGSNPQCPSGYYVDSECYAPDQILTNPKNPYDSAGKMHNDGIIYTFQHFPELLLPSGVLVASGTEPSSETAPAGSSLGISSAVSALTPQQQQEIETAGIAYAQSVDPSLSAQKLKAQFYAILNSNATPLKPLPAVVSAYANEIYAAESLSTTKQIFDGIVSVENQIMGDSSLSKNDQQLLLGAASVGRYSSFLWHVIPQIAGDPSTFGLFGWLKNAWHNIVDFFRLFFVLNVDTSAFIGNVIRGQSLDYATVGAWGSSIADYVKRMNMYNQSLQVNSLQLNR